MAAQLTEPRIVILRPVYMGREVKLFPRTLEGFQEAEKYFCEEKHRPCFLMSGDDVPVTDKDSLLSWARNHLNQAKRIDK